MSSDHESVSPLMPWYVNGTLADPQRARVDEHLRECVACRQDLALERSVFSGVTGATTVEYMPTASLKRLNARLDGAQHDAEPLPQSDSPARKLRRAFRSGALAASVALAAVGVAVMGTMWVGAQRRGGVATEYFTVTMPGAPVRGAAIRAVFAANTTVGELKTILDHAQLRIVAGPTEAGVYSLAPTSDRAVDATLAQLRQQAAVRFAEDIRPVAQPGRTP